MKSFAADVASSPTADITIYEVRIRLDSHKSVRPFKGIICDDVSEFESHMPSQPVQSLEVTSGAQKYPGHSRELAR
jgi:hypothetical protein